MQQLAQLFTSYSVGEIFTFLALVALSVKGVISFYDWAKKKIMHAFHKEQKQQTEKRQLLEHLQAQDAEIAQLKEQQHELKELSTSLTEKIDMLIDSDKDDIKAFITKEHHFFCYEQGWIDDYSLECCERRYECYTRQGGNSFIATFMEDLRKLPKKPLDK